jgi:hypothetical protein
MTIFDNKGMGGNTNTYQWTATEKQSNKDGTETLIGAKIEFLDQTIRASGTITRKGDQLIQMDGTYEIYELENGLSHLRVRAEGSIQFKNDGNIIVRGSCKGYYSIEDQIGWKPLVESLELGVEVPEHPNHITSIRNGRIRLVIGKVIVTQSTKTIINGLTVLSKRGEIDAIFGVGNRPAYMARYRWGCRAKSIQVKDFIHLRGNASAENKEHTLKGEKIKLGFTQLTITSTDPDKLAEYRSVYKDTRYTGQSIVVDLYDDIDLPPGVEVDGEYVGE